MSNKIKNKPKLPVVLVRWIDSCSLGNGTWFPISNLDNKISLITSVGFLLHSDKEAITIIAGYGDDSYNAQSNITIPKAAIKEWKKLKV